MNDDEIVFHTAKQIVGFDIWVIVKKYEAKAEIGSDRLKPSTDENISLPITELEDWVQKLRLCGIKLMRTAAYKSVQKKAPNKSPHPPIPTQEAGGGGGTC